MPTQREIEDKLIEMAYAWGDLEEWLETHDFLAGAEPDDYEAKRNTDLAKHLGRAFRVEADYTTGEFGEPSAYYILLYDVTDQESRHAAGSIAQSETFKGLVRESLKPWDAYDVVDVRQVRTSTPVSGQVCRRFLEEHPADTTPTLDDVPPFKPLSGAVQFEERGPYYLTPIEVPIYDRLAETGLTFSVQPFVQQGDVRYRPDFLILYGGGVVAVELDGHDWHKTKEQRGRDADKQNWFAARKVTTIRFTGSQVFADPDGCVKQIVDIVRGAPSRA